MNQVVRPPRRRPTCDEARPLRRTQQRHLWQLFRKQCEKYGDRTAHREKDRGIWKSFSWRDYYQKSKWIGLGLRKLGLERGQVVSILSEDRKEWAWFDMGIQCVGGISSGIYTTDAASQVQYLINDSTIRRVSMPFVTYVHLMFDHHQILLTEGLESESFLPGSYILDAMDAQTQAEIVRLFPELNEGQIPYGHAARRICTTAEARLFASIS